MDKNKEKLWTYSFIKICLVHFFIFVNFHALLPTFPFFIEYLGGTSIAIGVATALFSFSSIISRPFIGWFVDTKGRRTVLIIGLIGMALVPVGYFISLGIISAIILRTFHGAFHATSSNGSATWVIDIIPRSRMGEGLGMFGLSMAISTAVAPAIGLFAMNYFGFGTLFFVAAFSAIISLAIGLSIKQRSYILSSEHLKLKKLLEPMSIPASITQFFFMITYGVVEVYVAIYSTKSGLLGGGAYFIAIALATIITRFTLKNTIEKYGEGILIYIGNIATVVGIILLVFIHNPASYIISALLMGFSFGAVQPSLQTMALHAVSKERRGAASSTFFIAFDLGIALGAFIAGILIKHFGYDNMFLIISFASILSIIYYHIFGRNHISSMNKRKKNKHE